MGGGQGVVASGAGGDGGGVAGSVSWSRDMDEHGLAADLIINVNIEDRFLTRRSGARGVTWGTCPSRISSRGCRRSRTCAVCASAW